MQTITVNLGNRSYPIHVGHDILADIGSTYKSVGLGKTAAVVTNPTVAQLYLETLEKSLRDAGITVQVVSMPDGEPSAARLCSRQKGVSADDLPSGWIMSTNALKIACCRFVPWTSMWSS